MVRLGVLDLSNGRREQTDYLIESFTRHEKYNSRTKANDIAVIKLKKDVSFTNPQKIRPACLWQTDNIGQSQAIASGWGIYDHVLESWPYLTFKKLLQGYTRYAGTISNELMKVQLDLLDNNICTKTFEDDSNIVVTNNQICAGVLSGGRDTCQGGKNVYISSITSST